jgi:hypothetical protein
MALARRLTLPDSARMSGFWPDASTLTQTRTRSVRTHRSLDVLPRPPGSSPGVVPRGLTPARPPRGVVPSRGVKQGVAPFHGVWAGRPGDFHPFGPPDFRERRGVRQIAVRHFAGPHPLRYGILRRVCGIACRKWTISPLTLWCSVSRICSVWSHTHRCCKKEKVSSGLLARAESQVLQNAAPCFRGMF